MQYWFNYAMGSCGSVGQGDCAAQSALWEFGQCLYRRHNTCFAQVIWFQFTWFKDSSSLCQRSVATAATQYAHFSARFQGFSGMKTLWYRQSMAGSTPHTCVNLYFAIPQKYSIIPLCINEIILWIFVLCSSVKIDLELNHVKIEWKIF